MPQMAAEQEDPAEETEGESQWSRAPRAVTGEPGSKGTSPPARQRKAQTWALRLNLPDQTCNRGQVASPHRPPALQLSNSDGGYWPLWASGDSLSSLPSTSWVLKGWTPAQVPRPRPRVPSWCQGTTPVAQG